MASLCVVHVKALKVIEHLICVKRKGVKIMQIIENPEDNNTSAILARTINKSTGGIVQVFC